MDTPQSIRPAWITAFTNHGLYLRNWSVRTVRTYQQGLATLLNIPLTKTGLAAWVVALRQRGLTPGGVNMYARTVNSFLSWAHEEGLLSERLRVRLLPDPQSPSRRSRMLRFGSSRCSIRTTAYSAAHGRWWCCCWTRGCVSMKRLGSTVITSISTTAC